MTTITIPTIEFRLSEMRSKYEQGRGQLALLEKQHSEKEEALARARHDLEIWRQVQILFSRVSEYAREQLKRRIEETVTAALQAVFEDDRRFEIVLRTANNQPAADWQVVSYYGDVAVANEPESSRGGGVSDTVSLALRLALLELSRPKPGGPVFLDEPGKHVDAGRITNLAVFLKRYAEKTGRQVILITHEDPLAEVADKSLRFRLNAEGVSEVARA